MTESTVNSFAVLIERNDSEGETWRWYIPLAGNEEALKKLNHTMFSGRIEEDSFDLDLTPVPEFEVDILIKHGGDTTYMAAHNKLEGLLVIPQEALTELGGGSIDPLYKGRISAMMQASTP